MKKSIYIAPAVEVLEVSSTSVLCLSDGDGNASREGYTNSDPWS